LSCQDHQPHGVVREVHLVDQGGIHLLDGATDDVSRRLDEVDSVVDLEVIQGDFEGDLVMEGVIRIVLGRGVRIDGMDRIAGGGGGVPVIVVILPGVLRLRGGEVVVPHVDGIGV
jgi:hypothetical protein